MFKDRILWIAGCGLLAACSPVMSSRADSLNWMHDYDQALRTASEQDKPVIAYLETDWCTYCRQMEQTTLIDRDVIESLGPKFVFVKLNAEKDARGIELQRRFEVDSYPGILILDRNGEEIDRISGYHPAEEFRDKILFLSSSPLSFRGLSGRISADPNDAEAHFLLAERFRAREQYAEALDHYSKALQADKENKFGNADSSLYYKALMSVMVNRVDVAMETLLQLEKEYASSEHIADSILLRGQIYKHLGQNAKARRTIQQYLDNYPNHPYVADARSLLAAIPTGIPMAKSH